MKKENKKLSSWVSGGLIAVIIYILIFVSNIIPLLKILCSTQTFFGELLFNIDSASLENINIVPLFSFAIAPLIWFAGGSLIGWIIEKQKNNNL